MTHTYVRSAPSARVTRIMCHEAPQFYKFMPILEAPFSGPVNNAVMKIYEVEEKNALYQKTLNLACNLDLAKKKQPQNDLRSSSISSKKIDKIS